MALQCQHSSTVAGHCQKPQAITLPSFIATNNVQCSIEGPLGQNYPLCVKDTQAHGTI